MVIPTSAAANSALDAEIANCSARRRQIRKVFPQIVMEEQHSNPSIYQPIFVSIGPYHHGKQELCRAEAFKHQCLERFDIGKDLLYQCVVERIGEIRDCYAQVSLVEKYSDDALAWMLVFDSCFIINYMEAVWEDSWDDWFHCLGLAACKSFVPRDIMVLENQIPFFVLKLLMGFKYKKERGRAILNRFISSIGYIDINANVSIPREDVDPPIHFLEALRRVLVEDTNPTIERTCLKLDESNHYLSTFSWFSHLPKFMTTSRKKEEDTNTKRTNHYGWRSVMDLKAKGIRFRPSASHSFLDIKFVPRPFNGLLQLPIRVPSNQTSVFFSNMIAYELSPDGPSDHVVLSYAMFMKSLIQTVDDVKELQKGKVFRINRFFNHGQVVDLYKNINTFGVGNMNVYDDVLHRVRQHCNNRARTWMADLLHGNLSSPWTIMGLLSATLLIILTLLQTIYTMNSAK